MLRYDLAYDPTDEQVEQVAEVEVLADGTDGASRVVATLAYTELVDEVELEDDSPPFLSLSTTRTDLFGSSDTALAHTHLDVSGDALPDVFRASFAAGWQRVDHLSDGETTHWWEDPLADDGVPHQLQGVGGLLDQSRTVIVYDDPVANERIHATYGLRRLIDIDGDGILDLVAATEEPIGFDAGLNPLAQLTNRTPAVAEWRVWYGDEAGFEGVSGPTGTDEDGPFRFLEIGSRPSLPELFPAQIHPPSYPFEGPEVDLVDVDGDGWVDVVEVVPGDGLYVYRRIPVRGGGWEAVPDLALDVPILSLSASTGWVVNETDQPGWEYAPGYLQTTPVVEFVDVETALLGGDGSPSNGEAVCRKCSGDNSNGGTIIPLP